VVTSTPRPDFTPGKDPVPILQEAGCAPGPVWTGGKSRPHRDSIPDRPARSSVAIPTELPDHPSNTTYCIKYAREYKKKNAVSESRPRVDGVLACFITDYDFIKTAVKTVNIGNKERCG